VENNATALTAAYRFINEQGAVSFPTQSTIENTILTIPKQFIGVGLNASLATASNPDNSVNPGWRDALIDTVITTPWNFTAPWEEMVAQQDSMTNVLMPKLAELTPNGSAYLNEADFKQPDFKEVFYGANYAKLESIKKKYDPSNLFYAVTAVGSDFWEPQEDGRLCRA
jgi:hypothetical protein